MKTTLKEIRRYITTNAAEDLTRKGFAEIDAIRVEECGFETIAYSTGLYGCTGVLVECGFLSNYEEEQRLLQPEYQKKLAAVIAGTLSVWLSEEHPNEI